MLFNHGLAYFKPWNFFWTVQTIALAICIIGILFHFIFIFKGRQRSLNQTINPLAMLKRFFLEVLFQSHLLQSDKKRWLMHFSIFVGFIGLSFLSFLQISNIVLLDQHFNFELYAWKGFVGDLFGLLMLVGLLIAFHRRFVQRLPHLRRLANDKTAILLLLSIVITGFMLRSLPMALAPLDQSQKSSFFSLILASLFKVLIPYISVSLSFWQNVLAVLWIFHSLLTAVFLIYFPFSKFIHIIFTPIELLLNASEEDQRRDIYA